MLLAEPFDATLQIMDVFNSPKKYAYYIHFMPSSRYSLFEN